MKMKFGKRIDEKINKVDVHTDLNNLRNIFFLKIKKKRIYIYIYIAKKDFVMILKYLVHFINHDQQYNFIHHIRTFDLVFYTLHLFMGCIACFSPVPYNGMSIILHHKNNIALWLWLCTKNYHQMRVH